MKLHTPKPISLRIRRNIDTLYTMKKYKWKCEICGKRTQIQEVIVEEMIVCQNANCIKEAEKFARSEGDK